MYTACFVDILDVVSGGARRAGLVTDPEKVKGWGKRENINKKCFQYTFAQ